MAKFHTPDADGLRRMDDSGGLSRIRAADIKLPDASTAGKGEGFNFMGQLDSMTKAAKQRQAQGQAGLKVAELDWGDGLADLRTDVFQGDKAEQLLRQAKRLIEEKKYREALKPLAGVLRESPGHHEGLYLTALCHAYLSDLDAALQALLPLRNARLANPLAARVGALREAIRQRMVMGVLIENLLLMTTGQHDLAVTRLERVVTLDPDLGIYHFMLAGCLMQAERYPEAMAAVEAGMEYGSSDDRKQLEQVQREIERRYLIQAMQPALAAFRRAQYAEARNHLRRLDRAYQTAPLYVTFLSYLGRLSSGGLFGFLARTKSIADVAPAGSPADVEALYFFLVGDDVRQGRDLLQGGKFREAQRPLEVALKYAPRFPFANFLYGTCVFVAARESLTSGQAPDLDQATAELERARGFADVALPDKEITAAPDLRRAIQELLDLLDELRGRRKAMAEEAKPVNAAIDEFKSIMELVGDGISSAEQYKQVYARLAKLRQGLPALLRKVRSSNGKEVVEQLSTAVERNYNQLEGMKADVEEAGMVKTHWDALNGLVQRLQSKGGISSRAELQQVLSFCQTLKRNVTADRGRARGADARQALDKLNGHIDQILSQLRG